MVRLELEQRCSDLEDVRRSLDHLSVRWPDSDTRFVLLDTSFFTRYPTEIADLDLTPIGLESASVHLLLPMVVIDELDRLKERAPEFAHKRRSWSALTYLDKILTTPTDVVFLRQVDEAAGFGPVTLEVLFDPPGHVRMPNEDDEIVDRGAAVQALADRRVSILTYGSSRHPQVILEAARILRAGRRRTGKNPSLRAW